MAFPLSEAVSPCAGIELAGDSADSGGKGESADLWLDCRLRRRIWSLLTISPSTVLLTLMTAR